MPSMEATLNLLTLALLQLKPAASAEEGAQPPRPRPPTHRRQTLLLRIHVTPAPVRTEVSVLVAARDQDTLASVLVLASPAPIVRPTSTIARRRVVPTVVLVSMESMTSHATVPVLVLRVLLVKLQHRRPLLLPIHHRPTPHRRIQRLRINRDRREPSSRHGPMYLTTIHPIG